MKFDSLKAAFKNRELLEINSGLSPSREFFVCIFDQVQTMVLMPSDKKLHPLIYEESFKIFELCVEMLRNSYKTALFEFVCED